MPASSRFIDRLRKAARLEPVKREITLASGDDVVMWVTPLTAAERDRARKNLNNGWIPTRIARACLWVRKLVVLNLKHI